MVRLVGLDYDTSDSDGDGGEPTADTALEVAVSMAGRVVTIAAGTPQSKKLLTRIGMASSRPSSLPHPPKPSQRRARLRCMLQRRQRQKLRQKTRRKTTRPQALGMGPAPGSTVKMKRTLAWLATSVTNPRKTLRVLPLVHERARARPLVHKRARRPPLRDRQALRLRFRSRWSSNCGPGLSTNGMTPKRRTRRGKRQNGNGSAQTRLCHCCG
jgi:hypothetical protein